jgi:hypothetical protein
MKKLALIFLCLSLASCDPVYAGLGQSSLETPGIEEAPEDGGQYARKNAAWDAVAAPDLSSYLTSATAAETYISKTETKTLVVDGDFYGRYRASPTKKISPPDLGFGYTITNVKVQCASADPTTEFSGDLKWCDAQGTGAFPSTNPTVIKVLDTTTGNYDSGAITESVATGKELYISMDANVDYGVMWTITVTYQLATS